MRASHVSRVIIGTLFVLVSLAFRKCAVTLGCCSELILGCSYLRNSSALGSRAARVGDGGQGSNGRLPTTIFAELSR